MTDTKMQLVDWLDDLCVRFIINLPQEELQSVERICFQVEEAHWFYEDFIRPLDSSLPSMNLKQFCILIFQHCPLFSQYDADVFVHAYSEFLAYKTRVPVRGAILLNEAMDEVVLVKGWKKGARWSFPRGKINKDENDLDCAVREVYEETGFDARAAGLIAEEYQMKYIEVSMREQHMRLYVFRGVPMDTYFEPRTRKEISKISWYKLSELPTLRRQKQVQQGNGETLLKDNMFYMVAPFLGPLKHWIKQQNKRGRRGPTQTPSVMPVPETETEEEVLQTEESAAEDSMPAPPKMQDMHFDRLLAGLRNPTPLPDTTNLHELPSTQESAPDPAAELKRLLSVNGPNQGPVPAANAAPPAQSPNPLLAMLQGGGSGSYFQRQGTGAAVPETPFEQLDPTTPMQPETPRAQHHPRLPFGHMVPPPSFPFSPAHMLQMQPNNGYPSGPLNIVRPPPNVGFRQPSQPNPAMQQFRPQPNRVPSQTMPRPRGYPPAPAQAPRPYHRTGDPQFAQGPQTTGPQGPAIPPASNLPAPKLTPHTRGLLNAFKSDRKQIPPPPSQPAIKPFTNAAEIYKPIGTQAQGSLPIRQNVQVPQPPAIQPPTQEQRVDPEAHVVSPVATKPRSSQQESLLNLFKSPALSAAVPVPPESVAQATQEPVELSAQSPNVKRRSLADAAPQQTGLLPVPNAGTHAKGQAPNLSATVSGPLNEPNFDTLRKKPIQSSNESSRDRGPKALQEPQAAPQFSILSRPRSELSGTPSPKQMAPHPAQRSSPAPRWFNNSPRSAAEATKPFNPQILRRPHAGTSSPTPNVTSQPGDRRESTTSEQRNALLSLFGKSQTASPQAIPSGIISPVSPILDKQAQRGSSGDRSRISSIASLPADGGPEGRSTRGSMTASPADKSFLLGYLNGIVKDASK